MQLIVNTLIVLAIGLGLGTLASWYSVNSNFDVGGIRTGPWLAHPFASGVDVDPYTMARTFRNGTIPLGATEGLAFIASNDSRGEPLSLKCDYVISGSTPPSRLWTLAAYWRDGKAVRLEDGQVSAIHSGKIVRFKDGSFQIELSTYPRPGNWLRISGNGEFKLVLRVYDTPVTTTSGLVVPTMPSINRGDCVT